MTRKSLSRATLAGTALAVLGIVLFIILWVVLGRAGLDAIPRLLLSLCLPPMAIAALIGGYILVVRPSKQDPPG